MNDRSLARADTLLLIKTFTLKGNAVSVAAYDAGRDAIKSGYPAPPVSPVGQAV